jgi:hypothetical protein
MGPVPRGAYKTATAGLAQPGDTPALEAASARLPAPRSRRPARKPPGQLAPPNQQAPGQLAPTLKGQ